MPIKIIKDKISKNELKKIAGNQCGGVIMAVVDKPWTSFLACAILNTQTPQPAERSAGVSVYLNNIP